MRKYSFSSAYKLKINVELSVAQHETNVPVKCKAPRGLDVQSHVGPKFSSNVIQKCVYRITWVQKLCKFTTSV